MSNNIPLQNYDDTMILLKFQNIVFAKTKKTGHDFAKFVANPNIHQVLNKEQDHNIIML
jgi:hypothetical protein